MGTKQSAVRLEDQEGFLQRFSKWLRINYPIVWLSRIHLVLPFSLFIWGLMYTIGQMVPVGLTNIPTHQSLNIYIFICLAIMFPLSIGWVRTIREDHWEGKNLGQRLRFFFLVLICIGSVVMASISWVNPLVRRVASLTPAATVEPADEFGIMTAPELQLDNWFKGVFGHADLSRVSIGESFDERARTYGIEPRNKDYEFEPLEKDSLRSGLRACTGFLV